MQQRTPHVSPPLGSHFLCSPKHLRKIPSADAKILVLSIYLPITVDGWPKATSQKRGLLNHYRCHCPAKGLIKFTFRVYIFFRFRKLDNGFRVLGMTHHKKLHPCGITQASKSFIGQYTISGDFYKFTYLPSWKRQLVVHFQ